MCRPPLQGSCCILVSSMNPGISAWLDQKGGGMMQHLCTRAGSEASRHRLMNDNALFWLPCSRASPTLAVPGRALAWRAPLAFSHQSAGTEPKCTLQQSPSGVTSVYSHNACLLFSADTSNNDSVCSTDASQREQRVSDSNNCIRGLVIMAYCVS